MTDAEKLDKIIAILTGNDLDSEDKGLVGKVRAQGARLARLEKFKERGVYLIIGIALAGGYELKDLITHFL